MLDKKGILKRTPVMYSGFFENIGFWIICFVFLVSGWSMVVGNSLGFIGFVYDYKLPLFFLGFSMMFSA